MPDPIDALENFDPGAPMDPLPATEVRRRGDRRRRRRTTGLSLAAAAVVAVVATGTAVIAGDGPRAGTDPADNPSTGTVWLDQVPDDVDITSQMASNESGEPVVQTSADAATVHLELCGVDALDSGDVADRVVASASGPEYVDNRELRLYSDDQAASAALQAVRRAVADCPRETTGSSARVHTTEEAELGEETTVALETYEEAGQPVLGAQVWHVVRVGNAVLASLVSGEYLPGPGLEAGVVQQSTRLSDTVAALCVFSSDGCSDGTGTDGLTESALLTADEVPSRDRLGPWTDVPEADTTPTLACLPEGLGALEAQSVVRRSFQAPIAPEDGVTGGDTPISAVNVAVLEYADEAGADYGYEVAQGMVAACNADLPGLRPQGGTIEVPPYGSYRTFTYAAPDICTDCDAVRFDRMGVASVGNRLVLVSFNEVGGPLEPEGLDATMSALMDAAIARASR